MSKGEEKGTKTPNLVRVDEKLWGADDDEPSCTSVGEQRCGFIFRENGDWFGSDRYIIVRLLGKGGMCEVWLAYDRCAEPDDPKRFVAIKVLQSKLEIDEKSRKRLKAEALAFMKINDDPNLPRVYQADIDPERNLFYYVMEYLRGETLEERIRRDGPLPLAEAMRIVASVTEAVQVVHDMGIIHRDLKPENIFLTEDGRVVLLDLGVAKFDEERFPNRSTFRTDETSIAGTFAYMSPEQSLGEKLDVRSDIYALGIIAYCCITGRHPAQETPGGWMPSGYRAWSGWHLNNHPKSLLLIVPGLPANVWTVISKAIEKDRDLRFATAADLAIEFRDIEATAREIDLLTLPAAQHGAPSAEATTQPQTSALPANARHDAAALATTEKTGQGRPSLIETPERISTPGALDPGFDPRSRRSYEPHTGPGSLVPLAPSSEAVSAPPCTARGTEIIAAPPRSSVATPSPRTASGTEIIPVPSRAPATARGPASALGSMSRATPPPAPPRSVVPSAPPAPQLTAQGMRSTPSAHAIPIVRTRSEDRPRQPRHRIALFGAAGLVLGLAGAALVVSLVRPNGARATAAPTVTAEPSTPEAPASSPTSTSSAEPSSAPTSSAAPSSAPASSPTSTSSAEPSGRQTAKATSTPAAPTTPSTARQTPRTPPAPRPTSTTRKPKSDRILD
jgi:serine/threonine-protein kinase